MNLKKFQYIVKNPGIRGHGNQGPTVHTIARGGHIISFLFPMPWAI